MLSTEIELYYSFACQGSYRAHAWLRETGRDLAVEWRPYAIRTHGQIDYWGQDWYSADSELRGFIAAEAAARQGPRAAAAFRAALFEAVHEGGLDLGSTWSIFGSGTLASETYDQDTPTLAGGATMGTKGKQIPNAPKLMLKGGFTYRWQDLSVSPLMRYVGYRYGDSTQTQKVGSYSVFDLNAGYGFSKAVRLDLTVANLFDRKYISEISTNDFNLNGATAYYAGAPRTVAATISAQY